MDAPAQAGDVRFGFDVAKSVADDPRNFDAVAMPSPREVIAGVPMRMPLATNGFCGSNGIAFLFTVTDLVEIRFDRFAG